MTVGVTAAHRQPLGGLCSLEAAIWLCSTTQASAASGQFAIAYLCTLPGSAEELGHPQALTDR